MNTMLRPIAAVALSLASAAAFAQTPTTTPTPLPPTTGAAANADVHADITLDPAKPFGDLDVKAAGTTSTTIAAWSAKLNDMQKADLKTRCDKISNASPSVYPSDATSFCQTFAQVNSGQTPPTTQTR